MDDYIMDEQEIEQLFRFKTEFDEINERFTPAYLYVIGLNQGLKYKGNLKAGVTGGLAVLGTVALVNGFYNIIVHWDKIQNVLNHKED